MADWDQVLGDECIEDVSSQVSLILGVNKRHVPKENIFTINDKDIYMNELIGEGQFAKVYYACDHPEEAKLGDYTPDFRYACKVFNILTMS